MIAVKHTRPVTPGRREARYARAVEAHERIERELARVQNRWQKSRAALKRLEKALDAEFNGRAAIADGTPFDDSPPDFDNAPFG